MSMSLHKVKLKGLSVCRLKVTKHRIKVLTLQNSISLGMKE
jgi:hypothetical protein